MKEHLRIKTKFILCNSFQIEQNLSDKDIQAFHAIPGLIQDTRQDKIECEIKVICVNEKIYFVIAGCNSLNIFSEMCFDIGYLLAKIEEGR